MLSISQFFESIALVSKLRDIHLGQFHVENFDTKEFDLGDFYLADFEFTRI